MKTKNIHNIIKAIFLSSAFMLNSCIEEVFPENGSASIDQIGVFTTDYYSIFYR